MFFVKENIGAAEIKIGIQYENVYTKCPECGVEHQIDLMAFLEDEHFDIEGTSVWCPDCTAKRNEV